ncbi:MAG: nucleotide exchange factor GrpE [Planctomycetaceae bacterium]|nr:nucleotide exchange factor GrpE [Planctomycetaceae bacterium]
MNKHTDAADNHSFLQMHETTEPPQEVESTDVKTSVVTADDENTSTVIGIVAGATDQGGSLMTGTEPIANSANTSCLSASTIDEPMATDLAVLSAQCCRISDAVAAVQNQLNLVAERQLAAPSALGQIERRLVAISTEGMIQSKRSLLNDILAIHDLANSMALADDGRQAISLEEYRQRFSLLTDQISQVLELNGLQRIETRLGGAFDPTLHCAHEGVPCNDIELDRTISAVHEIGFRGDVHVFRPSKVTVWIYKDELAGTCETELDLTKDASSTAGELIEASNDRTDLRG